MSPLRNIPRVASESSASRSEIKGKKAQRYIQYFRVSGSQSGCMQTIETALDVPRVEESTIHLWFGQRKGFLGVKLLAAIAKHGAPVHDEGSMDIGAALAYSNHRNVAPHSDRILAKVLTTYGLGGHLLFRAPKRIPFHFSGCPRRPWMYPRLELGISTIWHCRRLRPHAVSMLTLTSRKPLP